MRDIKVLFPQHWATDSSVLCFFHIAVHILNVVAHVAAHLSTYLFIPVVGCREVASGIKDLIFVIRYLYARTFIPLFCACLFFTLLPPPLPHTLLTAFAQ